MSVLPWLCHILDNWRHKARTHAHMHACTHTHTHILALSHTHTQLPARPPLFPGVTIDIDGVTGSQFKVQTIK